MEGSLLPAILHGMAVHRLKIRKWSDRQRMFMESEEMLERTIKWAEENGYTWQFLTVEDVRKDYERARRFDVHYGVDLDRILPRLLNLQTGIDVVTARGVINNA